MSICSRSVSFLFQGSWQRRRPHYVFFGAPNTNNCCMLADFFSFSSCPSLSPPERERSGVTRRAHAHTIRGTFCFFSRPPRPCFVVSSPPLLIRLSRCHGSFCLDSWWPFSRPFPSLFRDLLILWCFSFRVFGAFEAGILLLCLLRPCSLCFCVSFDWPSTTR